MVDTNAVKQKIKELCRILFNGELRHDEGDVYGLTELQIAILLKVIEFVQVLVDEGADDILKTERGEIPLHFAARAKEEIYRLLLERESDVDAKVDQDGLTAMHIAIQKRYKRYEDIVQILADKSADVNLKTNRGETPLHIAAREGLQEIFRLLIKRGAYVDAEEDKYGLTAVHVAVQEGHNNIVQILIDQGANVNLKTKRGETPLHIAAREGLQEICRLLIKRGADVDAEDKFRVTALLDLIKDNGAKTALLFAARVGREDICRLLIEGGADVNEKDAFGVTALHLAAANGNIRIMEILLNSGVDIDSTDLRGNTALHVASGTDQDEAILTLIENGADVHIVNRNHETAFHVNYSQYRPEKLYKFTISQQHLLKMMIASFDEKNGNVVNLNITTDINGQSQLEKECKEEIKRMKSAKIKNTNLTFYDILTKRIDQIALYARSEDVILVLKGGIYQREFPTYEDIIKRRFNRGMVRKELLDEGVIFFRRYLSTDYDLLCIEKILNCLSHRDLTSLKSACKNVRCNEETKRETL
ncbi:serine/threonine-protein phosphatase 6 regulatory ankyrin repeat subunit C-like [Ceratina calcarata]|uniref:Serine/threonine-protein phosphatase 6 regulatory ankyrin repeat subunit C-like n=1 Tax=Ceratina calcarata TaxID=156304 RepID=A0AAJ7RWP1_9HYME|nr:serine/threonine-protein phosphatase 6 regulatory ankyrin repeat subunit C-like [Ceratina calcarata]